MSQDLLAYEYIMRKYFTIASFSMVLILPFGPIAHGASACETVVTERLHQLDIDMADVRSIFYSRETQRSSRRSRVIAIDAYVKFHSCKGSLVINMNRDCHVRQVYTRDECEVPGIPNY